MGCDIHCASEVLREGIWVPGDSFYRVSREEADSEYGIEVPEGMPGPMRQASRPYSGRNYGLFGILSGMRWEPPFEPLSVERGWPGDTSDEVRAEIDGWGVDGHSHTYATLAEILAFDWTQEVEQQETTHAEDYASWLEWPGFPNKGPRAFYRWIQRQRDSDAEKPGKPEKITQEELDARIATWKAAVQARREAGEYPDYWELCRKMVGNVVAEVTYKQSISVIAEEFLAHTVPFLLQLGPPEEVRLIWWFDN